MAFRDEREALRARNTALEDEVARLRRDNADLERRLAAATAPPPAETPSADAPPSPPKKVTGAVAVVAALLATTTIGAMFALRGDARGARPAPQPTVEYDVVWNAKVSELEGESPLHIAQPCTISARTDTKRRVHSVVARCEGVVIASSDLARRESTEVTFDAIPAPPSASEPDAVRFRLLYELPVRETSEQPRMSIDTSQKIAMFRRERAPAFKVTLTVDELSQPATRR